MNKIFTKNGREDYIYWQTEDRKTLRKINQLIEDIARNGNEGMGKPEFLKNDLSGLWSRRIDSKDRIIYDYDGKSIIIYSCKDHYSDH